MFRRSQRRIVIPFLLPALILTGLFFLYPLVRAGIISFEHFSRTGRTSFTGGEQYRKLVDDPSYTRALKNTFLLTFIGACMLFPPAVAVAWALHQKLYGESFFRFVVFAPAVLSTAVVALMWKFIYHPTIGLIDPALRSAGLGALARTWLGDPTTALPAIAFTVVWQGIGIWVVLLSAGFERLPVEVLEAGRVDGAGEWALFRRIMLPMLRDLMRILLVLWVVQSMQSFAFVQIMTRGGPFGSTDVVSTLMYRTAFDQADFGYAAAMGVTLLFVMLALTVIVNKVLKRDVIQY
ncbi:carbohydrate ABC transporter permease [Actinoallomurus iriomotensis]|uniref:Sugar ABC transporter permease n=1 Tax=Actinoallomurus iriomotensis TaxID=478107 RepID=A0A9W6RCX9_9ACTN|nr:sugar ABC transporter permease [Actinoallomurus iriomotensis]GLY71757.1 sugar ABC transporter permease [Actinoallomurus iriomotensis]